MPSSADFHHNEAVKFAAEAEQHLAWAEQLDPEDPRVGTTVALAQTRATLALAHRTAEQTAWLGDLFGDDSKLDGLNVTLRDISNGFAAGQP